MKPELKPCPFCGGKASFDHDDNGWNWIYCKSCDASTNARVSAMDDCRPLLAEAWNRRAHAGHATQVCNIQPDPIEARMTEPIKLPPLPAGYAPEVAAAMRNYARAAIEADRQARGEPVGRQHPDDAAVDAFAAAMKGKLAKKRAEGRGGWQSCDAAYLSDLLREHVEKGDPVDVANLAMMLHQNGQSIQPAQQQASEPLFWYRPCADGMYEGPVHNNSVGGKMLRDEKPGEWKPLYTTPQPQQQAGEPKGTVYWLNASPTVAWVGRPPDDGEHIYTTPQPRPEARGEPVAWAELHPRTGDVCDFIRKDEAYRLDEIKPEYVLPLYTTPQPQQRAGEPVAWLRSDELRKLGHPYSDAPLNSKTDSMMLHAKGTQEAAAKYGHDVPVFTAPQPQQVPEGYKLVPIEPTEDMLEAGLKALANGGGIYRAMLEASPEPKDPT